MPLVIRPVVGAQPLGYSVLKSSSPFKNKSALPSTSREVLNLPPLGGQVNKQWSAASLHGSFVHDIDCVL